MATHDHDKNRRPKGASANDTGDFIISGTQLGIGRTDNLSTLTVQARPTFPLSGTVDTTFNSAAVTGTLTKFLSELSIGDTIEVDPSWYGRKAVVAIASDTSLTVDSPFQIGFSGQATARPSAARFDNDAGTAVAVINDQGNIGIGTAGPRGMLEVTGPGAGDLDGCPVAVRVHTPLGSDVWPLIMSTESNDGTTSSTSGFAIWVTQMGGDGGATLTFSLFHDDNITLQDFITIDGNGLHLRAGFSASPVFVTTNYPVQPTDHYIFADSSAGAITLTLPSSSDIQGQVLFIYKQAGAHDVTIVPAPGETVNGAAGGKTISTQFAGLHLIAHGAGLWIASVLTAA